MHKSTRLILAALAAAVLSGCAMLRDAGVGSAYDGAVKVLVLSQVQRALEREGFAPGSVTADELSSWYDAVVASMEVRQIAATMVGNAAVSNRVSELIQEYLPKIKGDPGPEPEVPASDDHVARRITRWFAGVDMSTASIDPTYTLAVSPDGRDWSDAPASWPAGKAGPGAGSDATAMCCAAYQDAAGNWIGGKYEWHVRPPRPRDWGNIRAGYGGWVAPPPGTELIVWAYTADGNRISTEARVIYR